MGHHWVPFFTMEKLESFNPRNEPCPQSFNVSPFFCNPRWWDIWHWQDTLLKLMFHLGFR
jgi:hypothetical protein